MKKYLIGLAVILSGCSASRIPDIEAHAPDIFNKAGFKILLKEGWHYGYFATYGGEVWYLVEKDGTRYSGFISRWGDNDYQIYGLTAIDAIAP